jgi:hypothetical protein
LHHLKKGDIEWGRSGLSAAEVTDKHRLEADQFYLALILEPQLFTTHRGYVGLGLPGLVASDIVCIINGVVTPFILREYAMVETTGARSLVGDCYIHGLMDGEGLELGAARQYITLF